MQQRQVNRTHIHDEEACASRPASATAKVSASSDRSTGGTCFLSAMIDLCLSSITARLDDVAPFSSDFREPERPGMRTDLSLGCESPRTNSRIRLGCTLAVSAALLRLWRWWTFSAQCQDATSTRDRLGPGRWLAGSKSCLETPSRTTANHARYHRWVRLCIA